MAQYTHRTPPNQNPPILSEYDIVYRYRTIYRCNSIRYRIQYQVRYRVRCLIFHYGQPLRADFCLPWTEMLQMSTQSIQFLTASGVRSQGKLQQIQDPTLGRQRDWGPAVRNQHVDVALWKDVSSSNLCGSSCGIPQAEGAGIQGSWR